MPCLVRQRDLQGHFVLLNGPGLCRATEVVAALQQRLPEGQLQRYAVQRVYLPGEAIPETKETQAYETEVHRIKQVAVKEAYKSKKVSVVDIVGDMFGYHQLFVNYLDPVHPTTALLYLNPKTLVQRSLPSLAMPGGAAVPTGKDIMEKLWVPLIEFGCLFSGTMQKTDRSIEQLTRSDIVDSLDAATAGLHKANVDYTDADTMRHVMQRFLLSTLGLDSASTAWVEPRIATDVLLNDATASVKELAKQLEQRLKAVQCDPQANRSVMLGGKPADSSVILRAVLGQSYAYYGLAACDQCSKAATRRGEGSPSLCGDCLAQLQAALFAPKTLLPPKAPRVTTVHAIGFISKEWRHMLDITWKFSARRHGWDYHLIGGDAPWKDFEKRIAVSREYIMAMGVPDDDLFVVTDVEDVYFLGPPDEAVATYNKIRNGRDLVVSTERKRGSTDGDGLTSFPGANCSGSVPYCSLNSGQIFGTKRAVVQTYTWMLEARFNADQPRMSAVLHEHPEHATLDFEQRLLCSNSGGWGDINDIEIKNGRVHDTLTDSWPCVIHNPGVQLLDSVRPLWDNHTESWFYITSQLHLPHATKVLSLPRSEDYGKWGWTWNEPQ